LTQTNLQEVQQRFAQLSIEEQAKLINGISIDAAHILKKLLPDSPFVNMLVTVKSKFPNF
jgi:hypothetical protein